MRAAQQLTLACDVGHGSDDVRVRSLPLMVDRKAAYLQEVSLAVVADGEFHIDRVASQERLEFPYQGYDRGQRRSASFTARLEADECLQVVASPRGHPIGSARPIVVVDDVIRPAAVGVA